MSEEKQISKDLNDWNTLVWRVGLQSECGLLTLRAFLVMWPEHLEVQSCH